MSKINFEALSERLTFRARDYLKEWLPGGRLQGSEYCVSSLQGGKGSSLKINIVKGAWQDFATGEKGGDLIDLYAAIQGIPLADAARRLSDHIGVPPVSVRSLPAPEPVPEYAPHGTQAPDFNHSRLGAPTATYHYKTAEGVTAFYIARYDTDEGKTFLPWSWSSGGWVSKAFRGPRPLLGLPLPDNKPVLIVEGEKAHAAACSYMSKAYGVVTWSGGAMAVSKSDFTSIYGRKVLIWPDADEAGQRAAEHVAEILYPHCPEVKIIDTKGMPSGHDAADFSGFTYQEFIAWAKPRVYVYTPPALASVPEVIQPDEADIPLSVPEDDDPADLDPNSEEFKTIRQMIEACGLATTSNGQVPVCNADNALRVLQNHGPHQNYVWYDIFHNKIFTRTNLAPGQEKREWTDSDTVHFMLFLQRHCGMTKATKQHAEDALMLYARSRQTNEPKDWMDTLVWDGVPRISGFLTTYFWAEDSEYCRAISKNFWVSVAARTYAPGCKVDTMLILEGSQGKYKSTALSTLFSPWFAEATESVTSKDFYLLLQGKLVVEIAELDSFSKAETNTIKKVISQQHDRFRPPYGRAIQDFPRTSVFVGTTNEDEYLRDHTGARRFWPTQVEEADVEGLSADREQLFAESVAAYKSKATWWEVPAAEAREQQTMRTESDEWDSVVLTWAIGKAEVKISDVAKDCLGLPVADLSMQQQKRLGRVLRSIGFTKKVARRHGGFVKLWIRD